MNIYLYVVIFMIGTVFGSFYTLAVYRIPQNIDIVKKHSYCPNCNNKLGFFELIPVLSYILLGGKCKHCGKKIRPRYLILELLGGISFVVLAIALKIDARTINLQTAIIYAFTVLYFTAIVLIAGIDKEHIKIEKRVLAYGIIISILYMIYLYTIGYASIYRYAIYFPIYLATYAVLLIIDSFFLRKQAEDSYLINTLILLNMILIFSGAQRYLMTVIMSIIAILVYVLIKRITQRKNGNVKLKFKEIPIGYFICASNIIVIFMMTILTNIQ